MATPTEIRKGRVLDYNGAPHLVLDMMHRTQGRQAGFVQVTMRNLHTGSSTTAKFRSTDNVEFLTTETREFEFSYVDNDGYHFMDPETFEDVIMAEDLIGDDKVFISEGNNYSILYVDDKPVQLQLPASIELKVTEAPDAIKGDTSGAAQKPVTTETGLIVQTPLFVKTGDTIKVNTGDRTYQGRV